MLLYVTTKGGLYMSRKCTYTKCMKIKQRVLCLLILLLCYNININTVNTVSTALSFYPRNCITVQCFIHLLRPFSRSPAK